MPPITTPEVDAAPAAALAARRATWWGAAPWGAVRVITLYVGGVLAVAGVSSGQYLAEGWHSATPVSPLAAVAGALMFWTPWAVLTPALVSALNQVVGRRARARDRARSPRGAAFPFGWGFGLAIVAAGAQITLRRGLSLATGVERERTIGELVASHLYLNLAVAAVILSAATFWRTRLSAAGAERARAEAAARAANVERALAEARLALLHTQLQPHFLLNTLQGIAALTHADPARAEAMLATLGDLLREVVARPVHAEVSLAEELDTVRRYAALEQMRFGERLRVEVAVDVGLGNARVSAGVLQPLVENAIRHGLAPRACGGVVRITARRDGDVLALAVADDGVGLRDRPPTAGTGLGLAHTRTRLTHLYGAASGVTLAPGPAGGAVAKVRLPFRIGAR